MSDASAARHRRRRAGAALALSVALLSSFAALPGVSASANEQSFDLWREGLRKEALASGISPSIFDAAFAGVQPIARIVELDRSQPEFTLTFTQYLERVVPPSRIAKAREMLTRYRPLLEEVGRTYGVQPRFIVALWGIESDFGRRTGDFPVVAALATLAYDGRRPDFFRKELLAALQILEERHIAPDRMKGSWAGAMGQNQFMPTSFRQFAVDYDGDGRRDIWGTRADIFASIANYLGGYGWKPDQTWGRPVRLPPGFDTNLVSMEVEKPISEWQRLGVRTISGGNLPQRDLPASIVQPDGPGGAAFMVYENYRKILRWNRSTYFATAVGLLADYIDPD
ncbi:MAG: murein transglycosylase [Alphaproteobacteria bacterium]|nr:MAG: murein transglycosylase [Alphaproteobacteria bacterium]